MRRYDASRSRRSVPGRGALSNPEGRFERLRREAVDDGWVPVPDPPPPVTSWVEDASRTVIARNRSPDVPFDRSLNPYRGCEHGCIYCFARPAHARLGYSPGLDFESRLVVKTRAAELLARELGRPGYRPAPIALGADTDAWQPLERRLGITRAVLGVLAETRHPVMAVTKSALIERDLDLLAPMAARGLVRVAVSLTGLDPELSRRLEPRAAAPGRRLRVIAALHQAGVPVTVLFAPLIPALNDHELEVTLEAAAAAGAGSAGYVCLRLPGELAGLFEEWLRVHRPGAAERILARVRELHGGELYRSDFGRRMRGDGVLAELIAQRFRLACRRLGLEGEPPALDCSQFRAPSAQMDLFGRQGC